MFRTGRSFPYSDFTATTTSTEYKLAPNDQLSFMLLTNDGEKLVDPVTGGGGAGIVTNKQLSYTIEQDGMVKLPILGRVMLMGKTLKEVELFLEQEYRKFYNKPFVQLSVTNQRIFIFPGSISGDAQVLELDNLNTTLLEAIAKSGGIAGGKAHRIKLIRGDLKNPQVYLIDLSTIDGMKRANLVLQANDIIYIESRDRVASRALESIAPYLSLITTLLLIVTLFK